MTENSLEVDQYSRVIDVDGRAVHEMTGGDWLKDLRFTCEFNDK
jgi:hypothetical protein